MATIVGLFGMGCIALLDLERRDHVVVLFSAPDVFLDLNWGAGDHTFDTEPPPPALPERELIAGGQRYAGTLEVMGARAFEEPHWQREQQRIPKPSRQQGSRGAPKNFRHIVRLR